MSLVVDTNILVYAAISDMAEHRAATAALAEWTAGPAPWHVTWSIVYEFLRVVTHPRVFRRPLTLREAGQHVDQLLGHPLCSLLVETRLHHQVLDAVLEQARGEPQGSFLHDCHIAALMQEHGVRRILTADRGFERFPLLEVVRLPT